MIRKGMENMLSRRSAMGTGLALLSAAAPAAAQPTFPGRPIRIVVPYAPGGLTDIVGRLTAEGLSRQLGGTPVVVENRAGANSIVGAGYVATSAPDGHTLLMVVVAQAANATLYAGRLPFDPVEGFAPVSHVVNALSLLASSTRLPVRTTQDLIRLARERPGTVAYGSSGIGSQAHLGMEDLMQRTGGSMIHSPYRGAGPALQDLVAGRIGAIFDSFSSLGPLIASGQVRALAVGTPERSPFAPEISTFAEAGVPGFELQAWCMLLAPAGTPQAIVERLSAATAAFLRESATAPRLVPLGLAAVDSTPDGAKAFLRSEVERWARVIRTANIQAE